ncbi:hypothetical protein IWW49_003539, partial [Coemansia sp. RSA 1797]
KLLRFVGPGILVSQALLDPGNIESDISQADTSGYKLLWLLLLAHILCIFVQSLAARLGVVTGRHLAQHIRQQYPRPLATVFWLLTELAIIGADIQEVIGTATALHILTGIPIWAGVVITAVDSFLFLYVQRLGVRVTELVFGLMVTTLAVCFWVEMVLIKPDAREVIKGMVIPRIPQGSAVQAVGIVGCVLMPHNLFLHSALVGSRKLDRREETREGAIREAMRYFRIETAVSLVYAYLINMAVVVVFCKAFELMRAEGIAYVASLAEGANVLSHVLGNGSKYVYAVGLLAIGQSTTMTGTLSGQYVTEGFWNMPVKPWQRVLITRSISLVPALIVALTAAAHIDLLSEIINVLQAIVLSFTIIPLLKLQDHAEVMGPEFAFGRVARMSAAFLTLAIVTLNAYMVASVIPLDSPSMYVALCAVVIVYVLVLSYTAAFPLRCVWSRRMQFCCDNARPHVSFALAYALHRVATDMVAYPDKYPKVHGSWLRDARNIDTVAAGGRGGQTKTRSQKPKSGASGRASTEVTTEAAKMAAEAAAAKAAAEVAAASISGLLSSPKHDCKPGRSAGA